MAHPDVSAGHFASAHKSYAMLSEAEAQSLANGDDRNDRALAGLNLAEMSGIETGALTAPQVLPSQGRVTSVGHASTEQLIEKDRGNPLIDPAKIVQVGAASGENTPRRVIGGTALFDHVLASHVVEHVPNIIGWLEEIREVLTAQGTLRLSIPDKRFDFACTRAEATIADALDADLRKTRVPLPRMIIDDNTNYKAIDVADAWAGRGGKSDWKPDSEMTLLAARVALGSAYHDTRCWFATPKSFAELMERCSALGLMGFRCDWFHDTEPMQLEFLVAMSPSDDEAERAQSWRTLACATKQHG